MVRRPRLLLVTAGLLTVSALVWLGIWFAYSFVSGLGQPVSPPADRDSVRRHTTLGASYLDDGEFLSASQELDTALTLGAKLPEPLSNAEQRELDQLHRQATLLADLHTESLEEILRRLHGLPEREVQAAFERLSRGKALVFYTRVHRDATGRFEMDYRVLDEGKEARLEIGELKVLQDLPLRGPRLLLFGARLASIRRQANGSWVLFLDPSSGVLITHPGAASACCFQPPDREQLREVVTQQAQWVAEMP
jgi:hypothetical protein